MMNNKIKFNVFWSKDAELALIKHKQFINGCSSALTGEALKIYYGEFDPWLNDK